MRMKLGKEEEKSQLAIQICELAACADLHYPHSNKSPFINWYLVLRVNENADVYSIRKQYHKLALQLHPDKNKHSKAETAFKLVSEAYFYLSDNARRAAFDLERQNISCTKCSTIPYINKRDLHNVEIPIPCQETARSSRIQTRLKELRRRLKEETVIIEKCLMANARGREPVNANATRTESPIFNPSDYKDKGYPHHRRVSQQDFRAGFMIGNRCMHNTAKDSYPVFNYRSQRASFFA